MVLEVLVLFPPVVSIQALVISVPGARISITACVSWS